MRRSTKSFPPAGKFVTVESIRLHYVEKGSGPAVILLHGDAGSLYDYLLSPLFDLLAQNFRVLAFDRPGLGYSERPRDGGSPFAQARLIHAAAKALGLGKVIVVGHSRGGPVALAYGLQYPDDTQAVIPLAGAHYWDVAGTPSFNRLLLVPLLGPLLAHTIYVPFGRKITELSLVYAFSPERTPPQEYVAAYTAMNLRPRHLLSAASDQGESSEGMRQLIAGYKDYPAPLIILHGEEDRNVPFDGSVRLHKHVDGSRFIPLPGGSHEIMITRAKEIFDAISQAWQLVPAMQPPITQPVQLES